MIRAAVQISRSSAQRILRKERPERRYDELALLPPQGAEPHHLLTPRINNRAWQLDMMDLRILRQPNPSVASGGGSPSCETAVPAPSAGFPCTVPSGRNKRHR